MKYSVRCLVLLVPTALLGCGEGSVGPGNSVNHIAAVTAGSRHDPTTTGTVRGRVTWSGEIPSPPRDLAGVPTGTGYTMAEVANPWLPAVDRETRGLADAVLALEGVHPELQKAWNLPPVRIEIESSGLRIRQQDASPHRAGIVRPGDEITFISTDPRHHMLRARGAAFFTLPFPEPQEPLTRRLDTPGWVELSSGAGYYWHAAELLVASHPYHAVSDKSGRFTLTGVPPGDYTVIARIRDWHVIHKERDPETGLVFRQSYASAVEIRMPVTVKSKQDFDITVLVPASLFPAR